MTSLECGITVGGIPEGAIARKVSLIWEIPVNWITAAGASEHLDMEIVDYVPVYGSPAGTGGGWGFAIWR
ncbi:MAG: hypothetical protein O2909_13095 [Chloroflexi bacterium]|nr:hypothetical protein [Chloroflexota bacterium]